MRVFNRKVHRLVLASSRKWTLLYLHIYIFAAIVDWIYIQFGEDTITWQRVMNVHSQLDSNPIGQLTKYKLAQKYIHINERRKKKTGTLLLALLSNNFHLSASLDTISQSNSVRVKLYGNLCLLKWLTSFCSSCSRMACRKALRSWLEDFWSNMPAWMTFWSTFSLYLAAARIFSSTLLTVHRRSTRTSFCWPIRWARSCACKSWWLKSKWENAIKKRHGALFLTWNKHFKLAEDHYCVVLYSKWRQMEG